MSDDKTTENRLIFGVPSLSIAIGVWWYVWGVYGFWWGVFYGFFWPVWIGFRLAHYLLT